MELLSGEMLEPPERRKRSNPVFQALFWLVIAICVLLTAFNLYIRTNCTCIVVSGESMLSTIEDGDILFADTTESVERGDIVVMDVRPYKNVAGVNFSGDYVIKRAIALEGDSLYCEEGIVYIRYAGAEEYVPLSENYAKYSPNRDFETVTVEEGEIFVMGDNRFTSYDSRNVGCMKTENLLGVVTDWSRQFRPLIKAWYNFVGGNKLEVLE